MNTKKEEFSLDAFPDAKVAKAATDEITSQEYSPNDIKKLEVVMSCIESAINSGRYNTKIASYEITPKGVEFLKSKGYRIEVSERRPNVIDGYTIYWN